MEARRQDVAAGVTNAIGRVALAHDYLLTVRGAERTFAAIAAAWPDAPIHTTLYDATGTNGWFAGRDVRTSFLQNLNPNQKTFRALLPLFPRAVASLDAADADVVISSSSAYAHAVRPSGTGVHVCYCHSPFRYAWHERRTALREAPSWARVALDRVLERQRRWDMARAHDVTRYVANSRLTRDRIRQFYGRDAEIVHPPVELDRFTPAEPEDWFLLVGELVQHKRAHIALEGARRAGAVVKVVGDGPERARLEHQFPDAEFLGRIDDERLAGLYARASALLVPNVEEFGITAVESQAAGRPVIAPRAGGALDTVMDGVTGLLLDDPSADAFAEAIRDTRFGDTWTAAAVGHAQRFSVARFQTALHNVVADVAGHPRRERPATAVESPVLVAG